MSSPSTPRSCTIHHPSPVRLAVCGAIGTVGTLTVHALIASGVNVEIRAGCDKEMMNSEAVNTYRGSAVEVMELDYDDEQSVERVLTGVERVFLILPWRRGLPAMMERFIRVAQRCNCNPFIVKMSTLMTQINTTTPKPQIVQDVNQHAHRTPHVTHTVPQPPTSCHPSSSFPV
jgi:hypothetical protein